MIDGLLRKAIARFPPLSRMVKSPLGQHLVQTGRGARTVQEPVRFIALQLGSTQTRSYRIRGTGVPIIIRHKTLDTLVLNELFGRTGGFEGYEPPPRLAAALESRVPGKVLDLGGNIGLFGAWVRGRWPLATIESFEADAENGAVLSRVAASNGGPARWSVSRVAVANYTGEMTFVSGLFGESHLATGDAGIDDLARGGRAVTVPTVDFFEQDHDVDVLKMDIEGGEWSILTDPRMAGLQADVIVLEWHAIGCPEPDPRATAIRLLAEAGYANVEEVDVATYCGVLWAWREDPLSRNGL